MPPRTRVESIEEWGVANGVTQGFLNEGRDPTDSIIKIASDRRMSSHQIERLVKFANRQIAAGIQEMSARGEVSPHYTFDTIKTASVLEKVQQITSGRALRGADDALEAARPQVVDAGSSPERAKLDAAMRALGLDDSTTGAEVEAPQLKGQVEILKRLRLEREVRVLRAQLSAAIARMDHIEGQLQEGMQGAVRAGVPVQVLQSIPNTRPILVRVLRKCAAIKQTVKSAALGEFELNPSHPLMLKAAEYQVAINHVNHLTGELNLKENMAAISRMRASG